MTSLNKAVEGSIFVNAPLNQMVRVQNYQPQFSSLDKNFIHIKLHYPHKRVEIDMLSTSQWSTHKYIETSLVFINFISYFQVAQKQSQGLENQSNTTNLMHEAKVMNFKVRLPCCGHLAPGEGETPI